VGEGECWHVMPIRPMHPARMPQWLLRAVHNGEQRTEFPLTPLTKGGEGVGVGGSGVPSASDGASPLIAMRGVTKRFGALVACDAVDLQVAAGTLHAIMGENGAGKTTLMRLLYGYYAPDAGEIYLRGKRVQFRTPADAIAHHIGMVSQHYSIIPELSALDNLILGAEPTRLGGGSIGARRRRKPSNSPTRCNSSPTGAAPPPN
jgi:ABC-type glutathione transport system ATPase component